MNTSTSNNSSNWKRSRSRKYDYMFQLREQETESHYYSNKWLHADQSWQLVPHNQDDSVRTSKKIPPSQCDHRCSGILIPNRIAYISIILDQIDRRWRHLASYRQCYQRAEDSNPMQWRTAENWCAPSAIHRLAASTSGSEDDASFGFSKNWFTQNN